MHGIHHKHPSGSPVTSPAKKKTPTELHPAKNPPAASKGVGQAPNSTAVIKKPEITVINRIADTSDNFKLNESKVVHLDLTTQKTDQIETILKKLKDFDKIKISGLNTECKLKLFTKALSKLNDVKFNTTECDLSGNKLNASKLKQINTILLSKMRNLRSLDLSINDIQIGPEGARAIATSLPKLKSLNLSHNYIRDEGAKAIATYLTNLTLLDLRGNKIKNKGATDIAKSLTNLISLDLSNNNIGDEGARAIEEKLTSLKSLDLWNNQIGDAGAKALREKFLSIIIEDL